LAEVEEDQDEGGEYTAAKNQPNAKMSDKVKNGQNCIKPLNTSQKNTISRHHRPKGFGWIWAILSEARPLYGRISILVSSEARII